MNVEATNVAGSNVAGTNERGTHSLEAAQAHARSQAESATGPNRTPSVATELPEGVAAEALRWDETIGGGGYGSVLLHGGDVVRMTDVDGDTCLNLQVFNAALVSERLNPADTVKVQWQAYLGEGALLLSDLGRVLMTVVADTGGHHDALCGHANRHLNETRYGHGAIHGPQPSTRDLLVLAAARRDLGRRDLTAGVNLFAGVTVGDDGSLHRIAPSGVRSHVELRAELDVVLLAAVGPHPLDDRPTFTAGPVRVQAWSAERPAPDPFRSSSPERRRAFENTETFLGAGIR